MRGISAGLAACGIVAVVAACGTAPASSQGAASSTSRPATSSQGATPRSPGSTTTGSSGATPTPAGAGAPGSCAPPAAAPQTLTVTLASTGKTYCLHVGDKLRVYLRGTDLSKWLRPVANNPSLVPSPDPAGALARGVTGAAFAAIRPGRVLVTSVRPPCRVALPVRTGELEPSDPLPRIYPIQFCAPTHRFSVWITVLPAT